MASASCRRRTGVQARPTKLGLALQTLTPGLAESMGLDPRYAAAVVAEVAPGGQAAAAGLHEGDLILEIDRQRVVTAKGRPRRWRSRARVATWCGCAGQNGLRLHHARRRVIGARLARRRRSPRAGASVPPGASVPGRRRCFASPAQAAVTAFLSGASGVLAFGELHQTTKTRRGRARPWRASPTRSAGVAPRTAHLIVETWVSRGDCGETEKQVTADVARTTQRPARDRERDRAAAPARQGAGDRAPRPRRWLRGYPTLVGAGGQVDYDRLLTLTGQHLGRAVRQALALPRAPDRPLVLVYGGALHNDLHPIPRWPLTASARHRRVHGRRLPGDRSLSPRAGAAVPPLRRSPGTRLAAGGARAGPGVLIRGQRRQRSWPGARLSVDDLRDGDPRAGWRASGRRPCRRCSFPASAPDRRLPGDVAGGAVGLVDTDDPVGGGLAVLVLDGDGGAKEHAIAVRLRRGSTIRTSSRRLDRKRSRLSILAQLALAVDVLGVLRAVSLGGRVGQRAHHLGRFLVRRNVSSSARRLNPTGVM